MAQALTSLIYLIATNFTNLQIIPQTRLEIWHSNGNPSRICSTASQWLFFFFFYSASAPGSSQWLLTHSLGPKEEPTMTISPKTVNTHHLEGMQSQTPITVSYTSSQLASTCSQFQLSSALHATNSLPLTGPPSVLQHDPQVLQSLKLPDSQSIPKPYSLPSHESFPHMSSNTIH